MNDVASVPRTPEEVRALLAGLGASRPEPRAVPWQKYREAAAVLVSFEPAMLRPVDREPDRDGPPVEFMAECERVNNGARWRLRDDVRRATLRGLLRTRGCAQARSANQGPSGDATQRWLDRALRGEPIETVPREELAAVVEVAGWLDGLVDGFPPLDTLRGRLALEDLLRPLRALAGKHFRGRADELAKLRAYVGVLDSPIAKLRFRIATLLSRLRAYVGVPDPAAPGGPVAFGTEPVWSLAQRPPLVVYGAGGQGKSTLLARFVLEYVERAEAERFSFAYLNFDRPDLTIEEPLFLLAEMIRQLGFQYPSQRRALDDLRARIQKGQRAEVVLESVSTRASDVGELLSALRLVGAQDRPFLVLFDTFEEVQYTSGAYLASLWEFLEILQNAVPLTRVVFAGRSPIAGFATEPFELAELDPEAAAGYLASRGIDDPTAAHAIAECIGGNPLSLALAAEVLRREGLSGSDPCALPVAQGAQVQGYLYQRILGHIHDRDVRRLAHPGLVLRLVTPKIIREVLAEPCGLSVSSDGRARELFEALARESSLVIREGDALRHRADVRRMMLAPLRADQPDRVAEIHRRAVEHHAGGDTVVDRAEELYHRMCLGEESSEVTSRWLPEVGPHLRGALDELPARQRATLQSLLGIDLDPRTRAEADLVDWERDAEKRIRERLFVGREALLEEAVAIARERRERSANSPLPLLEAEVLLRLGQLGQLQRLDEARVASEAALARVRMQGDAATSKALRIAGEVARGQARYDAAFSLLEEGALRAASVNDAETRMECLLAQHAVLAESGTREALSEFETVVRAEFGTSRDRLSRDLLRRVVEVVTVSGSDGRLSGNQYKALLEALCSAFPTFDDLRSMARYELEVNLEAIVSRGSLRESAFQLIQWAESRGQVRELVLGALRHNPGNRNLHAAAANLGQWTEEPSGDVGLLGERAFLDLKAAAMSAGLHESRDTLLAGVDVELAVVKQPVRQMMRDLDALNAAEGLPAAAALATWINNALRLVGQRREATALRRALDELGESVE